METYHGHVRTPQDAIILFEACRLGLLPRVQRRLSEKERQQIKSGSVFVWDEREAGMRRWTDGKSWSASRVSGSFLTYREMEGKRGGNGYTGSHPPRRTGRTSPEEPKNGESEDHDPDEGPDGYRYKPDGLMKQSFSLTTNSGQHLHLISYYSRSQPTAQPLKQPSSDPALRTIRPQKGMYPEASVSETPNMPAVTRGPMPGSPYAQTHPHMGMGSPYGHPPPGLIQVYAPPGWAGSPGGTPPTQYAIFHPGPHHSPVSIAQFYGHPYHPQGPTQFDRPPPPLANPSLPPPTPSTMAPQPNGHAALSSDSYLPHYRTSASPMAGAPGGPGPAQNPYGTMERRPELPASSTHAHAPAVSAASNGTTNNHKPLTPPPPPSSTNGPIPTKAVSTAAAESLALPSPSNTSTTNGAVAPTKTIPSIGALINGQMPEVTNGADAKSDHGGGSRAGSKSPNNSAQRLGSRDMSFLGAGNGFGEDTRALRKLDGAFKS
ncbi:hypothetical protein P152DRAFT_461893 [Eremomyces bilateralis CBS 781.70]|uniref:Camp independent regulatory protein n=1 Tax=Eremomyces bilateralis CBS 781.70 TaxID=1392243 RepID=A0A6G1FTP2_9PEZI|nr:uncharacterized protein P152DRAFT_461893 [Eremomyces bilateralis CBS 781.70]KAF1809031.1 hypothetical protein P152DRAFT_461893 [Eremomyces bilateralis CBS 781.70]